MIIERTVNKLIVKAKENSDNYAVVGVLTTYMFVNSTPQNVRDNTKPHEEHTIAECRKLLDELQKLENVRA